MKSFRVIVHVGVIAAVASLSPWILRWGTSLWAGPEAGNVVFGRAMFTLISWVPMVLAAIVCWALFRHARPARRAAAVVAVAAICCLAIWPVYGGEYEGEFRVEKLAWELGGMSPAKRATSAQLVELKSIAMTHPDQEARVDAGGKLKALGF